MVNQLKKQKSCHHFYRRFELLLFTRHVLHTYIYIWQYRCVHICKWYAYLPYRYGHVPAIRDHSKSDIISDIVLDLWYLGLFPPGCRQPWPQEGLGWESLHPGSDEFRILGDCPPSGTIFRLASACWLGNIHSRSLTHSPCKMVVGR